MDAKPLLKRITGIFYPSIARPSLETYLKTDSSRSDTLHNFYLFLTDRWANKELFKTFRWTFEEFSENVGGKKCWRLSSFRSFLIHHLPDCPSFCDMAAPIFFKLALQFGNFPFEPEAQSELDFEALYRAWVFLSGSEGNFLSRWEELSESGELSINRRGFTTKDRRRIYFEAFAQGFSDLYNSTKSSIHGNIGDESFSDILEVVTLLQPGLTEGYLGRPRSEFISKASKLPTRGQLAGLRLSKTELSRFLVVFLILQRGKKAFDKGGGEHEVSATQLRNYVHEFEKTPDRWIKTAEIHLKSFGVKNPEDTIDWAQFDSVLKGKFPNFLDAAEAVFSLFAPSSATSAPRFRPGLLPELSGDLQSRLMVALPRALFDAEEAPSLLCSSQIPGVELNTISHTIESLTKPWMLLVDGISRANGEIVSFCAFTGRMAQYLIQLSPTQDVFIERDTTGKKTRMITFIDRDSTESVQSQEDLISSPNSISLDVSVSLGVFLATGSPKLEDREIRFEIRSFQIWQMNITDGGELDYNPEYHGVSEVMRFDHRKPAVY